MADSAPFHRDSGPVAAAAPFPGADGVLAGRFYIEARLGAGGMGVVFRARCVPAQASRHQAHAAHCLAGRRTRFLHEGQRAPAWQSPGVK